MAYIAPLFTPYGDTLGSSYTQWIYADRQSNPYYDQPEKWPNAGQVVFADRSLNFLGVANGATAAEATQASWVATRTTRISPSSLAYRRTQRMSLR